MINYIAAGALGGGIPNSEATPTLALEQRLALQGGDEAGRSDYVDEFYAYMKSFWRANPDADSAAIIEHLREFIANDGSTPYSSIPSHTAALTQLMEMLKNDGEEFSPIYATLNTSLGLSVVSNGQFNAFFSKMMTRPEESDGW